MSYKPVTENNAADLLLRKEFYSLKNSSDNFRDPEDAVDSIVKKKLKIRSHQLFVSNLVSPDTPYKRLHLLHGTGTGKCHGYNTPILMFDGTIKKVQDVTAGDQLMGDDSRPRNVVSIATGNETMYQVGYGVTYICNESHILALFNTKSGKKEDICLKDFMKLELRKQKYYKLYQISVDFPEKNHIYPAYELGLSIGDNKAVYEKPPFVFSGIPMIYKCGSHYQRMRLLAGILHAGGLLQNKIWKYYTKDEQLVEDILFVCRSLGIYVYHLTAFDLLLQPSHCVEIHNFDDGGYNSDYNNGGYNSDYNNGGSRDAATNITRLTLIDIKIRKVSETRYYGFSIDGNRRYVLGNFLVSHNTLAATSIAYKFMKIYRKIYSQLSNKVQSVRKNYVELDKNTPTVYVFGFAGTKAAFVRDLLKYPEFGFITASERDELTKRQQQAELGFAEDIKYYKDYYAHLKRRITNKSRDGFFKFYGYDEFVNRLFKSSTVKLTELEAAALNRLKAGEPVTLEDVIHEHIESGDIQVNYALINQFENSLLICDEIHNTYNMNMKNNRGIAIQFLLDTVKNLRFVSMSATPINNTPSEIIELVNYLVPKEQKITKKMFFTNVKNITDEKITELAKLTMGRFSFLQDTNIKYFPRRVFRGDDYVLQHNVGKLQSGQPIPYLKFIPCPMSEFHQSTLDNYLSTSDKNELSNDTTIGEEILPWHTIPTDGYAIYDMVFPDPESDLGMFKSTDVRNKLASASVDWQQKIGINTRKYSNTNNIITGVFLQGDNLKKYSSKYAKLVELTTSIITKSRGDITLNGKIMVYHNRVKMSGVLLIQEIFRLAGYLDETAEPTDNTMCVCGLKMSEHGIKNTKNKDEKLMADINGDIKNKDINKDIVTDTDVTKYLVDDVNINDVGNVKNNNVDNIDITPHEFTPIRYVMAHSDMEKSVMDQSLIKYNSPDNAHGKNFMILIGSKIIKESYDFKDIQHMIITSLPTNIPTLIQVFGRGIRTHSHINLPPEQRVTNVYILISTSRPNASDPTSPEVYRYADKISDYLTIQKIEAAESKYAIDSPIQWDSIMTPDQMGQYFKNGKDQPPVASLGNLYYEPFMRLDNVAPSDIKTLTFTTYNYNREETKTIQYIIKILFGIYKVFTYESLWEMVRKPPIPLETNPALFDESNFVIALSNLIQPSNVILSAKKTELSDNILLDKLFDYNDRFIYHEGGKYKVDQVGKYYIMSPVVAYSNSVLDVTHKDYVEISRDKDFAMMKELVEPNEHVVIDADAFIRAPKPSEGMVIDVAAYIKDSREDANYQINKENFISNYPESMKWFLFSNTTAFQINMVRDAIVYKIMKSDKLMASKPKLADDIIQLLMKFGAIIDSNEIKKYKDIAEQFGELPANKPLGYQTAKNVNIYDIKKSTWVVVSKLAVNRQVSYKENEIIIGIMDNSPEGVKFRMRKPQHVIKEIVQEAVRHKRHTEHTHSKRVMVGDVRFIERGIVCGTKSKNELIQILAKLGVSVSKLSKDIKIKSICEIIRDQLYNSEIKERQKDSRYKYMYFWWDEQPHSSAYI